MCLLRGTEWIFIYNTSQYQFLRLKRLVTGLSPRRSGFDPRSVHVRFVVGRMVIRQGFLPVLLFPLSASFHQCFMLISIYMFLLPKGQTDEVWELSKKAILLRKSEDIQQKSTFNFFLPVFKGLKQIYLHV